MSDLNDYLTDEMIEKAAKALADDWNPERYPVLTAMFRDYAQTALTAVLPDIIRQAKAEVLDERAVKLAETSIHTSHATGQALSRCVDLVEHIAKDEVIREAKAEALREAATAYQWGGWARNPQARGDLGVKRQQAEHAVKWLRDLADGIDQEADNE